MAQPVSKRDLIMHTLDGIRRVVPGDARRQLGQLSKFQQKLAYTAPELMDLLWQDIFRFLREEVPWKDAVNVWNDANTQFKQCTTT